MDAVFFHRDCATLFTSNIAETLLYTLSKTAVGISCCVRFNLQVAYGSREWKTARKIQLLQEEKAAVSSAEVNPTLPLAHSSNHGVRLGDDSGRDSGRDGEGAVPAKGGGPGRVVSSVGARISKLNLSFKASKKTLI